MFKSQPGNAGMCLWICSTLEFDLKLWMMLTHYHLLHRPPLGHSCNRKSVPSLCLELFYDVISYFSLPSTFQQTCIKQIGKHQYPSKRAKFFHQNLTQGKKPASQLHLKFLIQSFQHFRILQQFPPVVVTDTLWKVRRLPTMSCKVLRVNLRQIIAIGLKNRIPAKIASSSCRNNLALYVFQVSHHATWNTLCKPLLWKLNFSWEFLALEILKSATLQSNA